MPKIQSSDRLCKETRDFFQDMGSAHNGAEALSELVRWASTLMVPQGLEAGQSDVVGRPNSPRGEGNGYRSGYKPGHLDPAEVDKVWLSLALGRKESFDAWLPSGAIGSAGAVGRHQRRRLGAFAGH